MAKAALQIQCPCCSRHLEVDTRTGKVRALKKPDQGLDEMLSTQDREAKRRADAFERARDEQGKDSERFDQLFRKAREESKDDDSKPRSPFDLE